MERKRGGSSVYLVGYGDKEGRKYWILSGIWRKRAETFQGIRLNIFVHTLAH